MRFILIICAFLFSFSLQAKDAKPSPVALSQASELGRTLAYFDIAAAKATDVLMKRKVDPQLLEHYLVLKDNEGFVVCFGKMEGQDFDVAFRVRLDEQFKVKKIEKPKTPQKESGQALAMARALQTAKADFKQAERPYNTNIISFVDEIWVYLYPAPLQVGVWPLGKDFRYKISANGEKIIEKTKLHEGLIETSPPPKEVAAGFHNLVLSDIPTETDVMFVMIRQPKIPQIVLSRKYVFQISPDGAIQYRGSSDEFRKKK